jgi:CubicO group peptidase (beta-lactamase class C family)
MKRPLLAAATLALLALRRSRRGPREAAGLDPARIDAEAAAAMSATKAKGLAIAVVEDGRVAFVRSYGVRNAAGDPLTTDTVMYGASLTKAAFAYMVQQLVDEGRLDLDAPISTYLDKPLPEYPDESRYGPWSHLAGDERWRKLTPRILLTHSSGFANYHWDEADEKLRINFEPGSRYAYSGEALILLQFVLERGLGLDVGAEMQRRVFDRFGMKTTSMIWRPDFAANLADGWDASGKIEPHDERSKVRAAGSMDTTISDMARLAAGYVRGEGLSRRGPTRAYRRAPADQHRHPVSEHAARASRGSARADLASGLGVIVFKGPQGPGFFKGGHNDTTGNTWVCVEQGRRCVVILANDVRAEAAFPRLVRVILGETGTPWAWEYGAREMLP